MILKELWKNASYIFNKKFFEFFFQNIHKNPFVLMYIYIIFVSINILLAKLLTLLILIYTNYQKIIII